MNWEMLAAIATAVAVINAVLAGIAKTYIELAIKKNNDELLSRINGTYVRSKEQAERDRALWHSIDQKLDSARCHLQCQEGPISNR